MTKRKNYGIHPKIVRDHLLNAEKFADQIHGLERNLIELLYEIDQEKFYVRFGFKSLTGYCRTGLKFTKTQSQRIVTIVRQHESGKIMPLCTDGQHREKE